MLARIEIRSTSSRLIASCRRSSWVVRVEAWFARRRPSQGVITDLGLDAGRSRAVADHACASAEAGASA